MHRRLLILAIPVLLAGMMTVASAQTALAADGLTSTGVTTYQVVPSKGSIDVTIKLSIRNTTPDGSCGWGCTRRFYYYQTQIAVHAEAGAIRATSNSGAVSQKVAKTTKYYRYVTLTYPPVYYGQTRVLTITYGIPATPNTDSDYRAVSAYASLCVTGNGYDSGSVSIVMPSGFDPRVLAGDPMPNKTEGSGSITLSTGTMANPWDFWSCVDGDNPAKLTSSPLTVGDQGFTLKGWPEDPTWSTTIAGDITADVQRLTDMTALSMPGGSVTIQEVGNFQLGGFYIGLYDQKTRTVYVTEDLDPSDLAHELSHIWFNSKMFAQTWMYEGLAGYSEKAAGAGNYKACESPKTYPGTGLPDLANWEFVDPDSTTQEELVASWDYAASCWVITSLADAMGPEPFKSVMVAADKGLIAYAGATPTEDSPLAGKPISAKELLDLIDEWGMVPGGVTDLDQAQEMFATYGILNDGTALHARSAARAEYHRLVAAAGTWKMPFAVRYAMASWDFTSATTAMTTAAQILDLRKQVGESVDGLSLDGTAIQTQFEQARSQADLDALLTLAQKEADAAAKYARARELNDGGRNILQAIGLIGTDTTRSIDSARSALVASEPDGASTSAQQVIDAIEKSSGQGLLRIGILAGLLLLALGAVLIVRRRRRRTMTVEVTGEALAVADAPVPTEPPPGA